MAADQAAIDGFVQAAIANILSLAFVFFRCLQTFGEVCLRINVCQPWSKLYQARFLMVGPAGLEPATG